MFKSILYHATFFLLLSLLPQSFSFGGLGHCLTGVIAAQLLTPNETSYAQQYINFMAQNYSNIGTLGEAARWMDDIRVNTTAYDYWHYKQNCYSADSMTRCSLVNSPNSVTVINDAVGVMLNKSAPMATKGLYFLFLLHLLGDIHQPLHNIRLFSQTYPRGDSGGNAIPTAYQGVNGNLHEFWDNLCVVNPVNPSRPFSMKPNVLLAMNNLASQYIANYTFTPDDIKFNGTMSIIDAWVNQSYTLAVNYVYDPAVLQNGNLTDSYVQKCKTVIGRQVALSGQRLASILKYLFANQSN